MQEKDVATISIADCLPNLEDAEYLTARRDAFLEEVLEVRRQVLQVGEGVARSATKRFTLMASSSVPYKAAAGAVRRLRATPHGKKCGGSHLHSGGISMDYGMAADWSKSSTVSGFTTRVGATAAKTFLKTPKSGTVWAGEEEHPMKSVPTIMADDGKPVSQAQKMGQEAHHVGKLWDAGREGIFGVVAENGGFHVCLKAMELTGATYGPRSAGARGWNRGAGMLTSTGRVVYFLSPSDPRVPLQRQSKNLAAFYFDAIDAYVAANGREPSAQELHEFQMDRAYGCPAYDYEMHFIRDVEVLMATVDTETAGVVGDADCFDRMTRLLMNLFARTHATGYFPMMGDRIMRRLADSDSARAWHREFGFTTPSKNGIPMWMDRSVEMTVRFLRCWIGHRVKVGHDARMRRIMRFLKELIAASQVDSSDDTLKLPRCGFDEPVKTLVLGSDFWQCLDAYRSTHVVAGPGA
jgi:hypothetical protein